MKTFIKNLFKIEKKPKKGLMALEWVMVAYLVLTLLYTFFLQTKLVNPEAMIWGRLRILVTTILLWGVYRLLPCRLTRFIRVFVQFMLLAWWYPDTYELNRILPNFDHVFAQWDQDWFGCQPALLFSQQWSSAFCSEILDVAYVAYFPMIFVVLTYYFFARYQEFERASFIVLAGFFIYYAIYIVIPVAGPTFYYKAVGVKNIMAGIFPNVHDYFNYHQDCLPSPGYADGIGYHLLTDAHEAGERPTAAFPSSHVGITTMLMWLVLHIRQYKLFWWLLPVYLLLCISTVYIQAHYLIDSLAGFVTGTIFYFALLGVSGKWKLRS